MQRRHSDKPVTKPPIELPVRKNYSVIETAKSRPRPKSTQQVTGGAAGSNPVASAAASNLPPPPVPLQGLQSLQQTLKQPQKQPQNQPQLCQNPVAKDSIVEENLLISFDPPPKEKNSLFEEIDALYSEPVCSLKQQQVRLIYLICNIPEG